MTNIFSILAKLYTQRSPEWILELEDSDIQPIVIQKWLVLNKQAHKAVRFLNRYTFSLEPKIYLGLAWSVLPKYSKTPYVKWIKGSGSTKASRLKELYETPDGYQEIWEKIRRIGEFSDNDFRNAKKYLLKAIENDKLKWFTILGMDIKVWKKHKLNIKKMEEVEVVKKTNANRGLDLWLK